MKPPALIILGVVVVLVGAVAIAVYGPSIKGLVVEPEPGVDIKVKLSGVAEAPRLVEDGGELVYLVRATSGETLRLSPQAFSRRLFAEQARRVWWKRLMNVTSPIGVAWVAFGLLGQVLFTGRMIVQWLSSERAKRSVVPNVFWWMSLVGATMLLTYFLWRKDIVGVLGQGTGWLIYVRNLYLIYARHETASQGQKAGTNGALAAETAVDHE